MRINPMLCQSGGEELLDNDTHFGELKADGTRIWIIKEDDDVFEIYNRKGINYTKRLPEVIEAARSIPAGNFILDAEAVWFNEQGRTVFKGSQIRCRTEDPAKQRIAQLKYPIVGLVFDVLKLDNKNIENWTVEDRKNILTDITQGAMPPAIRRLDYTVTGKRDLFNDVVARGEEGLVLKRLGSHYERGARSHAWLKVKKWYHERCLVVGYTEGTGSRENYFGALVLAQTDDDGYLKYVGKVGSGFNAAEVRHLFKLLKEAEIEDKPVEIPDSYTPVNIDLEVTVKFQETTKERGVFRMPSLLKDRQNKNMIHYGRTITGQPKQTDLFSMLSRIR